MAKVLVELKKNTTLQRDDGSLEHFRRGEVYMDEADANHWWIKAHMVGADSPDPPIGSKAYADLMKERALAAADKAKHAAEVAVRAAQAFQENAEKEAQVATNERIRLDAQRAAAEQKEKTARAVLKK